MKINLPSPVVLTIISAEIATVKAKPIAIRMPTSIWGIAAGRRTADQNRSRPEDAEAARAPDAQLGHFGDAVERS